MLYKFIVVTIITLNFSRYTELNGQENQLIGLEVNPIFDVQFGGPINGGKNTLYWASELGTLMAGIDSTKNSKCKTSWSLSSTGNHSIIFGSNNLSQGDNSAVSGSCNQSYAENTTVFGESNIANASLSTIIGENNRSEGHKSFIAGSGNITHYSNEFVVGHFNDTLEQEDIIIIGGDNSSPLFTVGNGSNDENRSNALSVFRNGRVIIGNGEPDTDLHIIQSSLDENGGTGGIKFESILTNWQIYARGGEFTFAHDGNRVAYINQNGEFVTPANFLEVEGTKSNLKQHRKEILKAVLYEQNSNASSKGLTLHANQIKHEMPNLIAFDKSTGDPYGINYKQLYLTAIAALQEEIKLNDSQSSEIEYLKTQITQIHELLNNK